MLSIEMEQYLLNHIDQQSELLHLLDRQTHLRTIQPRMLSGHLQGAILKMIVRMINPTTVFEIGTFTGYSALSMAEGLLRPNAVIHTVEIDDEKETLIRDFFDRSQYSKQLILHIGSVEQALSSVQGEIDLVFMDGDKREYNVYYDSVLPRVRQGGFILADNVLWDGHVLEQPKHNDHHTQAIKEFNDRIAADQRIEKVILPIRDGLTIIRKL